MEQEKQTDAAREFSGLNRLFKSRFVESVRGMVKDGTFGDFYADWKWIFAYSKRYRWAVLFYIVLGVASSTLSIAASVADKYLVDIVVSRSVDKLWLLIAAAVGGTAFSLLFSSVVSRLSTRISIDVNNDIQADVFARILDADWKELSRYASGDLLNRFGGDVNTVASNAVNWLPNLIIGLYTFLSTLLVILHYDATMAVIALLSAPFLLLSSRYLMRRMRQHREEVLRLNSGMMSFENEAFYHFDTIKSFGLADRYCGELNRWQGQYRDCNLRYNLFSIKANIWMSALGQAVTYAAFGYCLYRLWSGAITYGTMTLFLRQSSRLASNFKTLVSVFPGMLNGAVSAHRVRELTELKKEVHDPAAAQKLARVAANGLTVRVEDACFAYEKDQPVLQTCSLTAAPREIVALVGPSGEGKTTLLRLLLGLIQPDTGKAVLAAGELEIPMNADTRRFFAYVPQGNTVLSGTIAENMRLVRPDATDAEIEAALRTACAWGFVQKMERGIHSRIGERGKGLSEGQAQRLAIARALVRNAPILLLDEATSALDPDTEQRILQNLMQECTGRTCIITTHRPSVLAMCSRIYRVKAGTVTELTGDEAERLRQTARDANGA